MKFVCLALLLVTLITGGQTADGDVGSACKTGDACTESYAYCDTSSKKCMCNSGWVQDGAKCKEGADMPCGKSQCNTGLVCSDGACFCDTTTIGYAGLGTNGTTTCSCPSGKTVRASDSKCALTIGGTCSAAGDCIDNAVCTGSKCTCDTSKFYAAGSNGDTTCSCDAAKASSSGGVCKLKLTKTTCASVSDCVSGTGVKCNSGTCGCDTALHLTANSGNTACECATNYVDESGTCKLKIAATTCNTVSDCVTTQGAKCNSGTCECDAAKNRVAKSDKTGCECATNYVDESGTCKLKIAATGCNTVSDCVTTQGAKCNSGTCECDATKNRVANAGKTGCDCASKFAEKLDKTCGKVIDEACSADTECIDNAKCTTSKCACDPAKNFAAGSAGASTCECAANYAANSDKTCGLKIGQTSCTADTDCVKGTGVKCSGSTCSCDTTLHLKAKSDNTGCECDTTKSTDESGTCKLNLGKTTCSADADCVTVTGKKCNSGTCGCDASMNLTPNSGNTACECTSDYTMEGTTCVLKVGKACNTTKQCLHGAICDKKTSTCLCDLSHNYKAGTAGATSCSCATTASTVTIDSKTYCVSKIGGACMEEAKACGGGSTCKSSKKGSVDFYQCTCNSGTANADGKCSGAENVAASLVMLTVGLMTSALL